MLFESHPSQGHIRGRRSSAPHIAVFTGLPFVPECNSQHPEQYLACCRCSRIICWMNEWDAPGSCEGSSPLKFIVNFAFAQGTWFTTTHPPWCPVSYITFHTRPLFSNLGPKKLASPRNAYSISQGPSASRWHPQNRIILGEFIYNGAVYKGVEDNSWVVITPGWKE